jgi:hypothetical protein
MSAINRLVNKFEMTGSMINNKKGVVGNRSVRTPEIIHHVEQTLTKSPKKCVMFLSLQLNLGASSTYRLTEKT